MRPVMEELAKAYEAQTGRRIDLDYGDSGSSLIKAETSGRGDLYVAHDPFHGACVRKGLSADAWVSATLRPMIAVPTGNPKGIRGLKDLARPGLRVILTDAQYSTAGHVVAAMARKAGIEEALEKNVVTRKRMGGEAANDVLLGHADATVVWQAVIHLRRDKLDAIPIEPEFSPRPGVDAVTSATFGRIDMAQVRVTVDVLKSSARPALAREFAEYVASPAARPVWERNGFGPPPAGPQRLADVAQPPSAGSGTGVAQPPSAGSGTPQPGAAVPQAAVPQDAKTAKSALMLYVAAGLKPAMDDLVAAYTAKTGAQVQCDYGGSGMLISRLRLARQGDLFFPGDLWYLELAEKDDLIASKTTVCYFVPVILVEKGNPKGIRGLKDLVRPGIRLGLGNPKTCQCGRTAEALFARNGIATEAVQKNLAFSSVTVNELGIQVTLGGLDAAIVWDVTAAYYADKADAVAIPPAENEVSNVAVGLLKSSADPAAAKQFVDFLLSPEGQAIFRKHHYQTQPPK
jgi:molybdate transport system substrate-binding protein